MPITKNQINRLNKILGEIDAEIANLDAGTPEAKRLTAAALDVRRAVADLAAQMEAPNAEG